MRLFYLDWRRREHPFVVDGAEWRVERRVPGRAVQWAWKRLGWPPFDALAGAADLFHFPNFIVPPLRRGRAVVTVHDVSFIRHPAFAEPRNLAFLRARLPAALARAARVLTVSRFSAREIEETLGVPAAVFGQAI